MWKEYKLLLSLVVAIVVATVGAITYFAPSTYAEETRQMVMQLSNKQQLKWLMSEYYELELNCIDLKTDEWVCSEKRKARHDDMLVDINVLRVELGLEVLEEE